MLVQDVDDAVTNIDDYLSEWPWAGIAYTTFRHTSRKPKFRVILFISRPVTPEEFADIWAWMLRRSGRRIDAKCKNPARLYFFPRVPDELALQSAWVRPLAGPVLTPEECVSLRDGDAVEVALEMALQNTSRNDGGYKLGRQLFGLGLTRDEIIAKGKEYVALCPTGDHPYTIDEFMSSLDQVEKHPPVVTTTGESEFPFREVGAAILLKNPILVTSKDNAWEYIVTHWVPITDGRMCNLVHLEAPSAKAKDANETVAWIRRSAHVGHTSPEWNQLAPDEVPLQNGVLALSGMKLRPHRMRDYLDRVLPHKWDPDAECPLWERCLQDWIGPDEQNALQEFFGYCLLPHAKWKKALILYGESNTGKSRITDALVCLVGASTVAGVPMDQMDDPRKLAPLRGASINLVSDLRESTLLADGGFKALVGGDPIQIDPKYEAPELYRPTAKVVVATNNLPRVNDRTAAVFNRLLIIHFSRVFRVEQQDRSLTQKLEREAAGILVWAVEGACRLAARDGAFSVVPSSEALVDDYRDEQNPVGGFLAERTVPWRGGRVKVSELHRAYLEWSKDRVTPAVFGRMLRGAGVETERIKTDGSVFRGVRDITLKQE